MCGDRRAFRVRIECAAGGRGGAAHDPRPHGSARTRRHGRMDFDRRARRARPSPPVDHRPARRRRPADGLWRRPSAHRLQRRDLQLQEPARGAHCARAPSSGPIRTPRCCCTSTTATAPTWCGRLRGMYAFALWDEARGGMLLAPRSVRHQAALLSPMTAGRCASPRRSRRCWPAAASIPRRSRPGMSGSSCGATSPIRSPSITASAPCRPAPRCGSTGSARIRPGRSSTSRKILAEAEPGAGGPGRARGAAARCAARFGSPPPHRRCAGRRLPVGRPRFDRDCRPGHGAGGHAPQHRHPGLPRIRGRRQ